MGNANDRIAYYMAFKDFLNAVGEHQAALKMGINVEDGVYPVQKVAYEYGLRGARLDQLISDRNEIRWSTLNMLDHWSQTVGFKPIHPDDKYKIMKFFENYDRRRYARANIDRALKQGETISVADLMRKRQALEKKKRKKEEELAGD